MLIYMESEELTAKIFQAAAMYARELLNLVNDAADQGDGMDYILDGIQDIRSDIKAHVNDMCMEKFKEREGTSNEKKNTGDD